MPHKRANQNLKENFIFKNCLFCTRTNHTYKNINTKFAICRRVTRFIIDVFQRQKGRRLSIRQACQLYVQWYWLGLLLSETRPLTYRQYGNGAVGTGLMEVGGYVVEWEINATWLCESVVHEQMRNIVWNDFELIWMYSERIT